MADDASQAAAIAGAAQVTSQAVNAWSAANTNKKERQWQENMYNRQKSDNQAQWHMQNEYNSPTSQMARLREAGLNPHLVYGKGADNVAAPMAAAPQRNWNPTAPKVDLGSVTQTYFNAKIQQAQYDNLKVQNTVQEQQAAQLLAQTQKTEAERDAILFNNGLNNDTRNYQFEYKKLELMHKFGQVQNQLTENEYQRVKNEQSITKAAEEIAIMRLNQLGIPLQHAKVRQELELLKADTGLKQIEQRWRQQGITQNDHIFARIVAQKADGLIESVTTGAEGWWNKNKPDWWKEGKDYFKKQMGF